MKIFSYDIIERHLNTIGVRNEVDEALTLPIISQDVLGINVIDTSWSWKTTMGRQIMFVLLTIYASLCCFDFVKDATDFASINQAYFGMLYTLLIQLKIFLLINSRENFKKSYLIAKTALFDIVKSDSLDKSAKLLKQFKSMVYIFVGVVIVPLAGYMINVGWHYFILGTRVNLITHSSLFPMISPYYEFGLIYQTIIYFIVLIPCFVVDFWFVIFIFTFCTASESLVEMLKVQRDSNEIGMEYKNRLNDTLKAFYGNHVKLVEFFNILNSMYKWQAVIPLFSAFATICVLLFTMAEDMQWHFVMTHASPALFQISAYNWFGEQVIFQGCELCNTLMEFDWTSMRLKDKKNYFIIIGYMNKEFKITTALGNDLSLLTMSSLLKASYQTCALLRSMDI
ncbi:uncharacterized protein LOC110382038 [Helicoverpa armigera]|uniref:uncharacterized protein LOC110382038 n=1 Tax=Helicoverpa armigera TaxID=29058 RepID=UPI0030834A6E